MRSQFIAPKIPQGMRQRDKFERKYYKTRTSSDWEKYRLKMKAVLIQNFLRN